jgi:hypothetical protein
VDAVVLPVALGGSPGKARFYCREANQGSFSADLPFQSQIEVRVQTLSEICRGHDGQETLIKLDIEGAEVEALKEFLSFERCRTTIVGELHQQQIQKPKLCQLVERAGWKAMFINEDTHCSHFHLFSSDRAPEMKTSAPFQAR